MRPVDPGDVGVVQRGQKLRLAVEGRVDGAPDDAHPALAELVDDAVVQQGLAGLDGHRESSKRQAIV